MPIAFSPLNASRGRAPASAAKFERVIFAGGGNRCFWQAGFWSAVAPVLQLKPVVVAAVSAGAAMACEPFGGTFERGFEDHKRTVQENAFNLQVRSLLRDQLAILGSINVSALERLKQGPDIRIVVARPPVWATNSVAMLLGAISVAVDAMHSNDIDAAAALRMGFRPLQLSVRDCNTPDDLADLILASSCVPALTPLMHLAGIPLLSGGLVGNVPLQHTGQRGGKTLVLLTRCISSLPVHSGYSYVQPSRPIPVGTWDYTNDAALQAAYELGRADGAEFLAIRLGPTYKTRREP